MSEFTISQRPQSSILMVYADKEEIELEPDYQRIGGIWTLEKRQLLIDTIINGFDLPKFYFHAFKPPKKKDGRLYRYAIVDGKQRLQAIWDFIDDELPLAGDFTHLSDSSLELRGIHYSTLARRCPRIKTRFDATTLHIMDIMTDDPEIIEDLFSRLNEAIPLNAPEKRNAFGGPLPAVIRRIAQNEFFAGRLPFPDGRYRHRDLATKFLYIEHEQKIVNTKKADLDRFVKDFKARRNPRDGQGAEEVKKLEHEAEVVLSEMSSIFRSNDPLLRQVGMITLFYHLFRESRKKTAELDRDMLELFEKRRTANREVAQRTAETDDGVDTDLLEFDSHGQTPNDAYALRIRLSIVIQFLRRECNLVV